MRNKLNFIALLAVLVIASITGGCTRIGPGHVGIKIGLAGSTRGVSPNDLTTGYVFYNPLASQVVEYPTYVQNVTWKKPADGSSEPNEEITFTTKDAMVVSADINLSYDIAPNSVPSFYTTFRSDDLQTFEDGYLHNVGRDCFNQTAGSYGVEDIMGNSGGFMTAVQNCLQTKISPVGVEIKAFGFNGAPRPPETVIQSINMKVQAQQLALQKENEIAQATADAQKAVATAKGQADAKVTQAEGDAKAQITWAQGDAEANRIRSASINPDILRWQSLTNQQEAIRKWNGTMPTVSTQGSTPNLLFNIPADK